MTEEEAKDWVRSRFTPEILEKLALFAELVTDENTRQNLIAPATMAAIWSRHIVDSLQLGDLANAPEGNWLDVGTGAGFPGLVLAIAYPSFTFTLAEPRKRRAEFLAHAAGELGLRNVTVSAGRAETLKSPAFCHITARAVASVGELLRLTAHLRRKDTVYILPRGRRGAEEVESLRREWQGLFHVEQSLTDPASAIVIASGVP